MTGAGSGIGRAVARLYASRGGTVHLAGRRADELEEAAREIESDGGSAIVCPADVTQAADRERLRQSVVERGEGLHALIHSAGIYASGPVVDTSEEVVEALFAVNAWAPLALSRLLLDLLKGSKGDVVFVNSSAVRRATGDIAAYAASKQALRALGEGLRDEVNADGVRVSSFYLGRTATPMQEGVFASEGRSYVPERLLQPEDVAETILHALALPRTAEVTDVHIRPALKS